MQTPIERLEEACTAILQSLRTSDDGSEEFRDILSRAHSLCDAIEHNADIGKRNAELGVVMMDRLGELVDAANQMILARSNPTKSADSQSEGEDA